MVDVNRTNNNSTTEIADIKNQLANLPSTASPQEREALQTRIDALGASRGTINNNKPLQAQNPGDEDSDVAEAKAALQAALGVDQASAGKPASPETRIPEQFQKLRFIDQAIKAGEKAMLKNSKLGGASSISTLLGSAYELRGYVLDFIKGLMQTMNSNKELMKKSADAVKPPG